jgi:hypothetical protein
VWYHFKLLMNKPLKQLFTLDLNGPGVQVCVRSPVWERQTTLTFVCEQLINYMQLQEGGKWRGCHKFVGAGGGGEGVGEWESMGRVRGLKASRGTSKASYTPLSCGFRHWWHSRGRQDVLQEGVERNDEAQASWLHTPLLFALVSQTTV